MGKFHGECYALKENNRGLFHIITKSFREARYAQAPDPIWDATMKVTPKRGTQAIREHPELKRIVPEKFLAKIEALSDNCNDYMMKSVQPREPLATICHGDYLRNNIAFKFDENVSAMNRKYVTGLSTVFLHANADAETTELSKL